MSFDNTSATWSAWQFTKMIEGEKIIFTNKIQRPYEWKKTDQSYFIDSIIRGVPVQRLYAKRFEDDSKKCKIYDVLDGKQRLTTIKRYINNEFALSSLKPITFHNDFTGKEETIDISELKFYELPEVLQEKIKNVSLTISCFDNLTKEEEKELFKRLNAGMKLSTKSRALASCKDLDNLLDIGEHELFKEMLSAKAIEAKNQVSLIMKMWCMLNQNINKISFESKNFNLLLEEIEVSEDERQELNNVFDMIKGVHDTLKERKEKKVSKKLYTELHMISLVPYFKQAIESNTDAETMADWITDFFGVENSLSKSDDYNMACKGGTAKNDSITTRHEELKLSYEEFFKEKE